MFINEKGRWKPGKSIFARTSPIFPCQVHAAQLDPVLPCSMPQNVPQHSSNKNTFIKIIVSTYTNRHYQKIATERKTSLFGGGRGGWVCWG